MSEQQKLLLKISMLEFLILELNLYLDMHPFDKDALEKLKTYNKKLKYLKSKYELTADLSSEPKDSKANNWNWLYMPWPWDNRPFIKPS